jgi:ectoine hydroxylase-related dioxygenase (phytanoyl-CoA dioxygenase family)
MTNGQIRQFRDEGYVGGLPVFSSVEVDMLNDELREILALLRPGESTKEIREWHEASRFLFDICMDSRILDYVEPLLGPNFYMWASNFFIKEPRSLETVSWHQDAYYWPLRPIESLTVWIAFDDVDEENGAMRVIPRSHQQQLVQHIRASESDSVLSLEADTRDFDLESVVSVNMSRGSISIHDDKLLHASPGNPSDRRRAGFTIRFSPNHVKCDLAVNPHFRVYQARGERCSINPHGDVPLTRYGRLDRDHASIEEVGKEKEDVFWHESEQPKGQ